MKSIYLSLGVLLNFGAFGQTLFGSYWNGSVEKSVTLDVPATTFSTINTLDGIQSIGQGMTSFDAAGGRYFNLTAFQIKVIDVQTGLVIDSILNTPRLYNIEYDPNANRLVGTRYNGTVTLFSSLDLATYVFTDLDTLTNTLGVSQGESAFDPFTNRYFNITNFAVTIINAQTGAVIDTIDNYLHKIRGIEFNTSTGKLMGFGWTGTHTIFRTLDPVTKVLTNIDTLTNVESFTMGESAFDIVNNRYFISTPYIGIVAVDATTGNIVDTIANTIKMKGLEVISTIENSAIVQQFDPVGIQVFPNPATNEVRITTEAKDKGSVIFICDLSGEKMYAQEIENATTKVNIENLPPGCYLIRDSKNNSKILVKQ